MSPSQKLSELDEDKRYRYFDELQLTMPGVWESMCEPVAITGVARSLSSRPHTLPTASRRTASPPSDIHAATSSWAATHSGE